MIKTRFIFPNFQAKTHEESVKETLLIKQVKSEIVSKIMHENSYLKEGFDPRIRLFHLGTELQDDKQIKEYSKSEEDDEYVMILHVFLSFIKPKKPSSSSPSSTKSKKEDRGDSICNCCIF